MDSLQTIKRHPILQNIEFGVGTWAWGDRLFWGYNRGYHEDDLREAFNISLKNGVTFFDTAEVYGQGQSELILGKFMKTSSLPVQVATKYMPFPWRLGRGRLAAALRNSLKRLQLDKVALYQMHWAFPPVTIETWMEGMAEAFQNGLIESVGVSNYDLSQTSRAYDALIGQGIPLASNQVEYHLLNRKIEKNGLLKKCMDMGITIIAYSPLAQGLLTGKYTPDNLPSGARAGRFRGKLQAIQPLVKQMGRIGSEHGGKTIAQVALNWTICKGTIPIPGAKDFKQAEQNLGCLGWHLNEDEVMLLDELSDKVEK